MPTAESMEREDGNLFYFFYVLTVVHHGVSVRCWDASAIKEVLYINAYVVFETGWRCGYGCGLYQVCKRLIIWYWFLQNNFFLQLFFLEEKRGQCLEDLATLIQKIYRGWKCRTHFLLLKKSQVVVAAWYRRFAVSTIHYTCHRKHSLFLGSRGRTLSQNCWLFLIIATKEVP